MHTYRYIIQMHKYIHSYIHTYIHQIYTYTHTYIYMKKYIYGLKALNKYMCT